MTAETKPPHVFGDDCEWVIAHDLEDARAVMLEVCGVEGWECEQESDDRRFACQVDDEGKLDDPGNDPTKSLKLTMAEWAQRIGRGYFCTTEG